MCIRDSCLLAGVGLHMLIAAFSRRDEEADDTPRGRSIWVLLATALGTSIDAMAVGVSLAFLNVNIVVVALAIGAMTFLMSSGGMLVGRMVGQRFGRVAEVAAGVALCGLGLAILI